MESKSQSISDVAISDFHQKDYQSVIEYKAFAFLADQTKTTFNYEVLPTVSDATVVGELPVALLTH
jgi:hypothetical protein